MDQSDALHLQVMLTTTLQRCNEHLSEISIIN